MNALKRIKEMLLEANVFTRQLIDGFLPDNQVKDLKDFDMDENLLPLQHSLGVKRNLQSNSFTLCVSCKEKT